jgi:SAM-dependent methyltransferase
MEIIRKLVERNKFFIRLLFFPVLAVLGVVANIAIKFVRFFYRLQYIYDWGLRDKHPNHFKHLTNLYTWSSDPNCNQFATAPSIARSYLKRGQKVLDLCCGDGSISFLFFSDIANKIDAVDVDRDAIMYGREKFGNDKIFYHDTDIFKFLSEVNVKSYDLIYFGSGFDYFKRCDRKALFLGLLKKMTSETTLVLKTPISSDESYMWGQEEAQSDFIKSEQELIDELSEFFNLVQSREVQYSSRSEAIAVCKKREVNT